MTESRMRFEDLFRAEYPSVVRVVAPIVGSVEDAQAIAQDAFAKAFARWRRIGGYERPGAWVRRVAIRDAVRAARRRHDHLAESAATTDASSRIATAVDLEAALRLLPVRQRACTVLHYLADWPIAEVAQALGCSEATVRVHLHRARNALAMSLALEPEPSPPKEVPDGC